MSATNNAVGAGSGDDVVEKLNAIFSVMFTKANIEADEHMVANMQPNTAFSFDVICSNPKVREITTDEAIVEAALTAAPNVEYANRTARPKLRVEQHSIILRDIPPDVSVASILKIFEDAAATPDGVACPQATAARSDLNNTWFVNFASEADTRQALACVRTSRFNGSSVKARLKTESLNKAFYAGADRYGPGTPGSASSTGTSGDFYSPGAPMMMQHGMFYGYPAPGSFLPPPPGQPGFPGMSPMGMGGMWGGPQLSPGGMGGMATTGQGYPQSNRQGKGGTIQQNNRNNRNNQRTSPRNPQQGRGSGYQQGYFDPSQGERPITSPGDGQDNSDAMAAAYGGVDETGAPRNSQLTNRRQGHGGEQGRRLAEGQQQSKKKSNGTSGAQNQGQNKRKDNKGGDQHNAGKAGAGNKGAQNRAGADGRRKNNTRVNQSQDAVHKGPNFNLNAADFPAAWEETTTVKSTEAVGGQKGSWTAALLGGTKAPATGAQQKANLSEAGAAAKATFSGDDHHSILLNSSFEKRERHHSFSSDQHISFVADAIDEPSQLHRVPTPIPSAEEVIERWQNDAKGTSPPPLHVNDSAEERHSHRIVPGTKVAKDMETLIFGSFKTPVGDDSAVVEENTNANTHAAPVTPEAPPAPVPGGKRSFMDVLKASKK